MRTFTLFSKNGKINLDYYAFAFYICETKAKKMTTSILNRQLTVINAAKEAGFKVNQFVEHSPEVEQWILDNTVSKIFDNGDKVEAVIVNGQFIAANYFVAEAKENFTIDEANWNELRKEFNF